MIFSYIFCFILFATIFYAQRDCPGLGVESFSDALFLSLETSPALVARPSCLSGRLLNIQEFIFVSSAAAHCGSSSCLGISRPANLHARGGDVDAILCKVTFWAQN